MREAPFEPSGFFVLRSPLLPLDVLERWGLALEAPSARDPHELAHALDRDRARLRAALRDLIALPELREALFIASPGFESRLDAWMADPTTERGARIEPALVRYVQRAAWRPTPFGLFAGHTLGTLSPETQLDLPPRESYSRRTRLDMRVLFRIAAALVADPAARDELLLLPNGSLHRAGRLLRYVETSHPPDASSVSHRVVSVAPSDYLSETLARARDGALAGDLARCLVDGGASLEEAEEYVGSLIDANLLVPEVRPTITTTDAAAALAAQLEGVGGAAAARALLALARERLAAIDAEGVGVNPARYRALASELEALGVASEALHLVQVNLWKRSSKMTLGERPAGALFRAVELLVKVGRPTEWGALAEFKRAFLARYENQEVALLEALDGDIGVGFDLPALDEADAPLIAGLGLESAEPGGTGTAWGPREAHLLRRVQETVAACSVEWRLDARDLEVLSAGPPLELPDAFALVATLERDPTNPEDGGWVVLAPTLSGQSGIGSIARLSVADPELRARVEAHLRAEEAHEPEAIFAEIVPAASGETANGLLRPVLRAFEVTCLGRSGAQAENQIALGDLRVSIVADRVTLRSVTHDRVVLVRSSTAHNARTADLSAYRFLWALARQDGATGVEWQWGALEGAPFLPRVRVDDVVLARARWRIFPDEARALRKASSDSERFALVQSLRRARKLPRHVALVEGDNALPVDLDNVLSVEAFLDAVKEGAVADLTESSGDPRRSPIRSTEGSFANELIVPFVRRKTTPRAAPRRAGSSDTAVTARTFIAGSPWLSTKIHLAAASADDVLRDLVAPLVQSVKEAGVDRWFFLPVPRPDAHLRLRLHGDPSVLHALVLPALERALGPWIDDGRIRRFEVDTYEREIERYGGGEGIVLAERLFTADSDAALALVAATAAEDWADARWRLVALGHDALLGDLGMPLEAKLAVVREIRERYAREFRLSEDQERLRLIASRFREERGSLDELLERDARSPLAFAFPIFAARSTALETWARDLHAAEARGVMGESVVTLARSYLHLNAGRLLRAFHREQELVIADALCRLYTSRMKRRTSP